jgi:putative membrane protein
VSAPEERVEAQEPSPAQLEQTGADPLTGAGPDVAPPPETRAPASPKPVAERTRTATAFSGVVAGAVVFLALLIFILGNTEGVKINFFGATGHVSLGVALLLASVAGALIVAVLGAARISQLRRRARRLSR